ncbi:radical SAM protein [Actinocorallia sp. API 0066]|uniref:radical SAM protein n=1 Tax=Actinocorallia sp. API 0066 TaxID=2896846 RepID=UPI001E3476A6|nr:radical SAM protein [Actinocorallia sp. API 0066]MCD0453240.1 radical SAM protein [Actinocorallia sp. API 0066]
MHEFIVSPYMGRYVMVKPGGKAGGTMPAYNYRELAAAAPDDPAPEWLAAAARRAWGVELEGKPLSPHVLVREDPGLGYGRASWELNLGCNYDCPHCYLGVKKFEGLEMEDRVKLLRTLRDAGVLWLQMTGGEPMVDRWFIESYQTAYDLGMMITLLTNGSRLFLPGVLDLLTKRRPDRITVSVYGATQESYDKTTSRTGAYRLFMKGITAAHEAGLPLALSMIVTQDNAHEVGLMRELAERIGAPMDEYTNMVPTIYGGDETLPTQSAAHLRKRQVFTGCNAGHTFFHVNPFGKASICKVGRDPSIDLIAEGVEGLSGLGAIADSLLLRQGGCTGCQLQGTCGTCMPLVQLYRKAKAPLATYCQHREKEPA